MIEQLVPAADRNLGATEAFGVGDRNRQHLGACGVRDGQRGELLDLREHDPPLVWPKNSPSGAWALVSEACRYQPARGVKG
ncbi:MAG: hypothetical protein B9S34_09620 [Opitutia bacterium Tous-C1TDCM]|nr:MAG: hypothetical protein B9S34_09620 [Opitutae bacterium Tous-C1TDCM]